MTDQHHDDALESGPRADRSPDTSVPTHDPFGAGGADDVVDRAGDDAVDAPGTDAAADTSAGSSASDGARSDRPRADDAPQYGVGPFSVREVALLGVWVVAFFTSFFRTNIVDSPSRALVGGENVWLSGLWWIPAIALPTVAVGLIVLRRLSPEGIRRVGSLGIDQFASVAFSVAAIVWIAWVWDTVAIANEFGGWARSWVIWVEAALMVVGVVLTVFGPLIPPFEQDFQGRREVSAHRNARPIRAVVPRPRAPRAPRPAPQSQPASESAVAAPVSAPATTVLPVADDANETDVIAPLGEVHPDDDASFEGRGHSQAFWALVPVERDVVDDYGTPIFRIGPTAWALVIEDRGETFVVRHDDGRIGYLHDVSGVTRG